MNMHLGDTLLLIEAGRERGLLRNQMAYAVAIAAAAAVLVSAYLKGRSDSKTAQTARDAQSATKARKIENEVSRLDDSAVDARLAKWMRDKR